jgi:hypothetical protein
MLQLVVAVDGAPCKFELVFGVPLLTHLLHESAGNSWNVYESDGGGVESISFARMAPS